MNRADYLRQNAQVGTYYQPPPELIEDVDGIPAGFAPSDCEWGYRGGVGVTLAELAAVGLTPADVPKLTIINPPKEINRD